MSPCRPSASAGTASAWSSAPWPPAGTLGILIPPSIGLIIYGVLVEESIGRLYMGGFLPGFLLAFTMILMMIVTSVIFPRTAPMDEEVRRLYRAWFHGIGVRRYTDEQMTVMRQEQTTEAGLTDPADRAAYRRGRSTLSYPEAVAEWLRMVKDATVGLLAIIPVLIIILVVLGSIYTGWATPTEAAALGVFGALVVAIANELYKKPQGVYADWNQSMRGIRIMLLDAIISTVRTSSMIMLIVMAAFTLSFAFARLGISQDISEWITGLNLNALQFVIILVFFYLLLGTFMESFAMLVTTIPILTPSLEAVGVDLVWFGIIMVILVEAALISPPEGINLYILHGVRQDVDAADGGTDRGGAGGFTRKHDYRRVHRGLTVHGLHGPGDSTFVRLPGHCAVGAVHHLRRSQQGLPAIGQRRTGRGRFLGADPLLLVGVPPQSIRVARAPALLPYNVRERLCRRWRQGRLHIARPA